MMKPKASIAGYVIHFKTYIYMIHSRVKVYIIFKIFKSFSSNNTHKPLFHYLQIYQITEVSTYHPMLSINLQKLFFITLVKWHYQPKPVIFCLRTLSMKREKCGRSLWDVTKQLCFLIQAMKKIKGKRREENKQDVRQV